MRTIEIMERLSNVLDEFGFEHGPINVYDDGDGAIYYIDVLNEETEIYFKMFELDDTILVYVAEEDPAAFTSVRAAVDWIAC